MTPQKRALDLLLVLLLSVVLVPVLLVLTAVCWIKQGRPIFYGAERMRTPTEGFTLWKFRTMTVSSGDSGVSGGDKRHRITPLGRKLRHCRADELPQLWNVLRGDISFVGPRPPLRQYVERCPALYAEVLKSRPGITGLASLRYHRHEELLLAACGNARQTDRVYVRRCVPRKARLDLIYQARQSLCLDLALIWETARRGLGLSSGRRPRQSFLPRR